MKDIFTYFHPKYMEMHIFRKLEIVFINSLKESQKP